MIGHIRGRVVSRHAPNVLIDAGGVGYEITLTTGAMHTIRSIGEEVTICTHFVVREDAMSLYGFADQQERELFRELIRVSGIGPKVAMAILSGMSAEELINLVAGEDSASLTRLPGIGKKTAERIVVELKDRLKDRVAVETGTAEIVSSTNTTIAEAESGLVALGYKPVEAAKMIKSVATGQESDVETLIREALRGKMRSG